MKNASFFVLSFFVCTFTFSSCFKDNHDISAHDWEFRTIHPPDGSRKGTGKTYVLSFTNPANYHFNTDVNECSGLYYFGPGNDIGFDPPACSMAAGDSDFVKMIGVYLPQVTYYEVRGRNLNLKGPNVQIDLRRK